MYMCAGTYGYYCFAQVPIMRTGFTLLIIMMYANRYHNDIRICACRKTAVEWRERECFSRLYYALQGRQVLLKWYIYIYIYIGTADRKTVPPSRHYIIRNTGSCFFCR